MKKTILSLLFISLFGCVETEAPQEIKEIDNFTKNNVIKINPHIFNKEINCYKLKKEHLCFLVCYYDHSASVTEMDCEKIDILGR